MLAIARIQTFRGLAPNADQITEDDILEVDGAPPASMRRPSAITVPPPSGKRYLQTTRYSMIAPRRRRTLRLIGDEG